VREGRELLIVEGDRKLARVIKALDAWSVVG